MATRKNLVTNLKQMVKGSPLASSSILGFILVGLEKLVDINFECPCNGAHWNLLFSSAFIIIPAVMALLVMLIIEDHPWRKPVCFHVTSIIMPPLVWLILVFLDGEYIDCAMTDRKGKYVQMEGDPTHRWCKLLNNTEDENQLILRSKYNMVISQIVGIVGLAVCCMILAVIGCYVNCKKKSKTQNGDSETDENLTLRCSGHVISVKVHNDEEVTTL